MAKYLLDTWTGLKEKKICTLVYKTFHKIHKFQANKVLQFMNIVAVKGAKWKTCNIYEFAADNISEKKTSL